MHQAIHLGKRVLWHLLHNAAIPYCDNTTSSQWLPSNLDMEEPNEPEDQEELEMQGV